MASASVLPPAPAQKSTTRIPGSASTSSATSWLPSSWISTSPSWNVLPGVTGRRPGDAQAPGATAASARLPRLRRPAPRAPLARRLQQVDAQVERRRVRPGPPFPPPVRRRSAHRSCGSIQSGTSSRTASGMSGWSSVWPSSARSAGLFRRVSGVGAELAAGDRIWPRRPASSPEQQRGRDQQARRCRRAVGAPATRPGGGGARSTLQTRSDDGAAVAAADEAALAEEVVGDGVGWAARIGLDRAPATRSRRPDGRRVSLREDCSASADEVGKFGHRRRAARTRPAGRARLTQKTRKPKCRAPNASHGFEETNASRCRQPPRNARVASR